MKTWNVSKTASKGYAIGQAFVVEKPAIIIDRNKIDKGKAEEEIKRYERAVEKATLDLEKLAKTSEIFAAHGELVQDIALYEGVVTKIKNDQVHAECALQQTSDEYVMIFESMEDEYMRERAADMKDVSQRLLFALQGIESNPFAKMSVKSVVIAEDLTPSDTAKMNMELILGFATEVGGVTSHVSIIAKNMGIPCLVGVGSLTGDIKTGDSIVLDAGKGTLYLEPSQAMLDEFERLDAMFQGQKKELEELSVLPSVTSDGVSFELCANVGNISDIEHAIRYQIDGVGLFRSEFLYMESDHFPTEEEQFQVYKQAAILLEGKELTIRTLDIGGDKGLDYYEFPVEENPFLGYRAIRISLDQPEVLKAQLRALLRASAFGYIRIMYPMIISLEELFQANETLEICKQELRNEGITFDEKIKVGMMVETPAAVLLVEEFAKQVDFFSIGTNDLTQYLLAVDRGNLKVASLYNSYHPAVLRAIHRTIQAGHAQNIKVGMCGEFASDEKAAVMLLGMGLDEFSMAAGEVARVKYQLRNCKYEEAKHLAEKILKQPCTKDVMGILL